MTPKACSMGKVASRELTAVLRRWRAVKNTPLIASRMIAMMEMARINSISVKLLILLLLIVIVILFLLRLEESD